MVVWIEFQSRDYLNALEELLSLRHRKTKDQPSEGRQKSILVAGLQTCSRQKVRADVLQGIAAPLACHSQRTSNESSTNLAGGRSFASWVSMLAKVLIRDSPLAATAPNSYFSTHTVVTIGRRTGPVLHRKSAHFAYGWMTTSPRIFSNGSKSRSRCKRECPCRRQYVAIKQSIVFLTV